MVDPRTPPLDDGQRRAVDVLRTRERFLLASHVRPDGDGIGAQAALARVLQGLGKTVHIVNPDAPEDRFDYLTRELEFGVFRPGDRLPDHDVTVLLDISELSRCGPLAEPLAAAPSTKVVVDHHVHHGDVWWDEAFVDVTASATGLLVHRIARALGCELDPVASAAVFTSIVTDTGWFKYSNTDAETLRVAAELTGNGLDPSRLFNEIYQRQDATQPFSLSQLLGRVEYFADRRLAVMDLSAAEAERHPSYDSDTALDILRSVRDVEVVLYLRELREGGCKLSARSKTAYDVNRLARAFGGGGHVKASGATIPGTLADVRARIVEAAIAGFDDADGSGA